MKVSIIGTGNMARGIGARLLAGGHSVTLHAHTSAKGEVLAKELRAHAVASAAVAVQTIGSQLDEVVVLAVPYAKVAEIIKEYEGQFTGKTVVDITNPVDFSTFQLIPEPGTSGAEEIARQLPDAHVVKAFNTAFAATLVDGQAGGQPLDIFIAGDDQAPKQAIMQLITDGGMRAIDTGVLSNARHLEGLALIHMSVQQPLGLGFASGIKIVQ